MSGRLTTVFAKEPRPGAVKTRLSPPLAPEEAAELAEAMLDDTLEVLAAEPAATLALRVAPADAVPRLAARYAGRFPGLEVAAQRGDGLGARLAAHFDEEAAARPGWSLVVVGSDAPQLGAARVRAAHAALERGADVVLGPGEDGGYHLVGLRRPVPELFLDVAMSSADTCARTLALARARGLAVEFVERGRDIDVAADLAWLAHELARGGRGRIAPSTARLVALLLPRIDPQ